MKLSILISHEFVYHLKETSITGQEVESSTKVIRIPTWLQLVQTECVTTGECKNFYEKLGVDLDEFFVCKC